MSGLVERPLRVLMVEDSSDDALLIERHLRRAGFLPTVERVDDLEAFRSALDAPWDVIIADFNLPRFTAMDALAVLAASTQDAPFIVVSGSVVSQISCAWLPKTRSM